MSHVTLSQIRFLLDSIHGILDVNYKKATEDDVLAMLAETGAPMGVADADGSVFTDENGNILIM